MSLFFILKNMMLILSKAITENLSWGTVKKNSSEFMSVEGIEGKLIPVSIKETQQLKVCFLKASKLKKNRSE
ncbi:hypothetical protein [Escherichia coli]|uniref:hypothetical protein n=1 Tax=Escherichia coli TaxID=562 RepID=UPI000403C2D4|nr:hypothetical protein [Escherichia coli]